MKYRIVRCDPIASYHWSARNQLTNMLGSVVSNFKYDGLGRRIERTVASTTEKYLYDGLDIIVQKDGSGNVRGRYLRGLAIDEPWQRIDITPAQGNQTTTTNRIYLADALGSIVALADTNKVIQTEYDYEPFGATTNSGAGNKNSYKFTAREDDATGLYYYRARYYHPVLGRFVSEDPIDVAAGEINLFVYGENNPLFYIDPSGLEVVCSVTGTRLTPLTPWWTTSRQIESGTRWQLYGAPIVETIDWDVGGLPFYSVNCQWFRFGFFRYEQARKVLAREFATCRDTCTGRSWDRTASGIFSQTRSFRRHEREWETTDYISPLIAAGCAGHEPEQAPNIR